MYIITYPNLAFGAAEKPKQEKVPVPESVEEKKVSKPEVREKRVEPIKHEEKTVPLKISEPTHIPAFHELQKTIRTDIKAETSKDKKNNKKLYKAE